MDILNVCLSLNIYYLLLRLLNVLFVHQNTESGIVSNTSGTLAPKTIYPLDCPNLNCKEDNCVIDKDTGARICLGGCDDGWKGVTCQRRCRRNCQQCHKLTGVCQRCKEDWAGLKCNIYKGYKRPETTISGRKLLTNQLTCRDDDCLHCHDGWYGDDCSNPCAENCYSGCQKVTGHCDWGCKTNYMGSLCDDMCPVNCRKGCNQTNAVCHEGCKTGFYGSKCMTKCKTVCDNGVCDRQSGLCWNEYNAVTDSTDIDGHHTVNPVFYFSITVNVMLFSVIIIPCIYIACKKTVCMKLLGWKLHVTLERAGNGETREEEKEARKVLSPKDDQDKLERGENGETREEDDKAIKLPTPKDNQIERSRRRLKP